MALLGAAALLCPSGAAQKPDPQAPPKTSFEERAAGELTLLETAAGRWTAAPGNAAIANYFKSGRQCLRLLGGENRTVEFTPATPAPDGSQISFWAERWTAREPFRFRIEALLGAEWKEIYAGDQEVKVGRHFLSRVTIPLPEATAQKLRFVCTSPANAGLLLDDFEITRRPSGPMKIAGLTTVQPVMPVLIRKTNNPVLGLRIEAEGALNPLEVTEVRATLDGTTRLREVRAARLLPGAPKGPGSGSEFGSTVASAGVLSFKGRQALAPGENWFWICVDLAEDASLEGRVDATVDAIVLDNGTVLPVKDGSPAGAQRIGVAVRKRGDDGVANYRIPGLAATQKGTLIGVYDIRRAGGGDLPGDIDVGMSRSADGGRTWEPMRVIMDMGSDPKWRGDGIGDPAVLVDPANNRIWVAGLWSHGDRAWSGSGPGMTPEETGQLILVHSDDDGLTWSKPINITGQVKKPEWRLLLQGPGRGIALKDGTLVFAAQFKDAQKIPHSTLIYSWDHGKTWVIGTGVKSQTTEAQIVELGDGSIMINCRDDRGGARTIATTRDLGKTWTLHPTDRKALNEPVCMASLLRIEHPKFGPLLLFSNPNTPLPGVPRGRYNMTIKVSTDEGMTWPEARHTLYDSRLGAGYSCLTPIGENHVGVLYEGLNEIFFLRFSLEELMRAP